MKLIGGEYDNNGNAVREYVYLENMPIALISNERNGSVAGVANVVGSPRWEDCCNVE